MTDFLPEALAVGLPLAAAQAGVLALLVWGSTAALGERLPAAWRCGLWLVVLARLAVPVAGPVGVAVLPGPDPPPPVAAEPAVAPPPPVAAAPPSEPAAFEPAPFVPPPVSPPASAAPPVVPEFVPPPLPPPEPVAPPAEPVDWFALLAAVWAAGAGFRLVRIAWRSVRLGRAVRSWPAVTDPAVLALFAEAKAALGVRRAVRLKESPAGVGPAACGAFRPAVLLPADLPDDPAAVRSVLLHEVAHLARRDVPIDRVVSVIRCLWWPHPAAHLAAARWRADRELACDAAVLTVLSPADRPAYGRAVVALLSRPRSRSAPSPAGSAGLSDRFPPARRRIEAVTRFRPPTPARRLLAAGLLTALTAACLVAPTAAGPPDEEPSPDPPAGPVEPAAPAGSLTVAGTVSDEAGEPLEGVRVRLSAHDGPLLKDTTKTVVAESTTGADGRFEFGGLPPLSRVPADFDPSAPAAPRPDGRWAYVVGGTAEGRVDDFAWRFAPVPGVRMPQETASDADPTALTLKLVPAVALTGTVVDAAGEPVAGARVAPPRYPADAPVGAPGEPGRGAAVTGADGRFTLTGLAPYDPRANRVRVGPTTTSGPGPRPFEATAEGFLPTRIEPDAIPPKRPILVVLKRGGFVTGSVVDAATGEPAAGVNLWLLGVENDAEPGELAESGAATGFAEVVTDAAGEYRAGPVPAGFYVVQVRSAPSDRTAAPLGGVRVLAGETTAAPPVRLTDGARLTVRFENADGEPVDRVPYQFDDTWGGDPPPNPPETVQLQVGLVTDYGGGRDLYWAATEAGFAEPGPDGSVTVRLPAGVRIKPYVAVGNVADEWEPRPWMKAGLTLAEGEERTVTFRALGSGPSREPPDGLTFPEPAEPDRAAAAAVRGYGGFYDLDDAGRVVEVNLVSHRVPAGTDPAALEALGLSPKAATVYNQRAVLDGVGPVLASLPELKKLTFWRKQLDNDDLAAVGLSPSLEEVSAIHLTEGTAGDAGMAGLARAKTLRSVRFAEAGLTDGTLKAFGTLPNLEYLNLFGNQFTDEGVTALAGAKSLGTLILGSRRPDPDVGGPIFQDTRGVTDAGARALFGLKNLTFLDVQGSSVTDATPDALAFDKTLLPNLKTLWTGGSAVTDAALANLKASRPGLNVRFSDRRGAAAGPRAINGSPHEPIVGVATDGAGGPVANARVGAFWVGEGTREDDESAAPFALPIGWGATRADGTFRLRGLSEPVVGPAAGRVVVYGWKRGRASARAEPAGRAGGPVRLLLPPAASLTGRITNADGTPAAGVRLTRVDPPGRPGSGIWSAVTDADGRFEIADLPETAAGEGPVRFSLTRGGERLGGDPGEPVAVRAADRVPGEVEFSLPPPAAAVRGRAVDRNGEPVAGARAFLLTGESGTERLADVASAGPDGRFVLRSDRAGGAVVRVAADGFATADLTVEPGKDAGEVTLGWAATLSGRVTDAVTGEPIAGAVVVRQDYGVMYDAFDDELRDRAFRRALLTDLLRAGVTDDDGRYEIDDLAPYAEREQKIFASAIPPPGMPIRVTHQDYNPMNTMQQPLPGTANFVLDPAAALTGRVVDADGSPVAGVRVLAAAMGLVWLDTPGVDGQPSKLPPGIEDAYGNEVATTDDAGRYRIFPLPAGNYRVSVGDPPDGLVAAPRDGVPVEVGKRNDAPDLVLTPGGMLTGRLLDADGEPLSELTFRFPPGVRDGRTGKRPEPRPTSLSMRVEAPGGGLPPATVGRAAVDKDGRFAFRLPPGRYVPMLNTRGVEAEWVPEPWMTDGVEIIEGETAEVTLRLEPVGGASDGN